MKKLILAMLLCICFLFTGAGNATAAQEERVFVSEKDLYPRVISTFYDNKWHSSIPLILAKYNNGKIVTEDLNVPKSTDLYGSEWPSEVLYDLSFFRCGNNRKGYGGGHEGVFFVDWGNNYPNGASFIFNAKTNKFTLLFDEAFYVSERCYAFDKYTVLSNGYVAYEGFADNRIRIIKPDGTKFKLDFNYGGKITPTPRKGNFNDISKYYKYFPVAINYSAELQQYVLVCAKSAFMGKFEDNGYDKFDLKRCKISVMTFDVDGNKINQYNLDDALFFQVQTIPGYNGLASTLYPFMVDSYFSSKNSGVFYLGTAWKFNDKYIKDGSPDNIYVYDGEEDDWNIFPDDCKYIDKYALRIDIETGEYKFILQDKYYSSQPAAIKLPFLIERKGDTTVLLPRNDPDAAPLAVLDGDYYPVDYSLNADGSCEMIFAPEKAV